MLFFLISGYIIPNSLGVSNDRIGRFVISRFFRLYPLYWFVLALTILLVTYGQTEGFGLGTTIANITMIQGYLGRPNIIGAAWTLQIELTFYVLCAALAYFRSLASPRACALVSLSMLAFAFLLAIARYLLVMKLPVALPLALSLMFFGTLWRQAKLTDLLEAKRLVHWQLVIILLAIVPISVIGYNHDFGYHEHWQPYLISYLLAITVFVLCTTRIRIDWKPAVFLGEISYSIYLMHSCVPLFAIKAGLGPEIMASHSLLYWCLLAMLVIPAAWLTYNLVEQPFNRWSHRLIARRQLNT